LSDDEFFFSDQNKKNREHTEQAKISVEYFTCCSFQRLNSRVKIGVDKIRGKIFTCEN